MRGDLRLVEQDAPVRIDPAGDHGRGHFQRAAVQFGRIVRHRNGMQVGEEEQALLAVLHIVLHAHPVADRPEVIAEVEIAGGLDAGNYPHVRTHEFSQSGSGRPGSARRVQVWRRSSRAIVARSSTPRRIAAMP